MAKNNATANRKADQQVAAAVAKTEAKKAEVADDLEQLLLSDNVERAIIRQGRGESAVADAEEFPQSQFAGKSYDDLCIAIRALEPNGAILLRSGRDFDGKLETYVSRIKQAIENREKRGNKALTKKEVKIEALKAGSELVSEDANGNKRTIQMPWNAVRIRSLIGVE